MFLLLSLCEAVVLMVADDRLSFSSLFGEHTQVVKTSKVSTLVGESQN